MAEVAEALGTPLMPWQRYVADVALEINPKTGRLRYREVVLTVPRQSGKTSLILPVAVHRAIGFGTRQAIIYTAQTRNDARMKWEDEHQPMLEASPLAPMVTTRKRTGAEAFVWKNGSVHGINAPTAKAGHGKTLDLGFIDEAFARPDDLVEQAFRPAMITRPQPQLWVVSTAGTAESTYLRAKVEAGRRRVEGAVDGGQACYFEWSAPDEADPLDPATWRGCMPALGHTIDESAIRAELQTMLEEHGPEGLGLFRRAYLNQWPDLFAAKWSLVPERAWRARETAPMRPTGSVAFAVAAAWPDAESTAIAVAGRRGDEIVVQVVKHAPGTSWVVEELARLSRQHRPAAVVLDRKGPAGRLEHELQAARVRLTIPTVEDVAQAAQVWYASVAGDAPTLRHFGQPELDIAVAGAGKRLIQDRWTFLRKDAADISPLEAVALAQWAVVARSKPAPPTPRAVPDDDRLGADEGDLLLTGF